MLHTSPKPTYDPFALTSDLLITHELNSALGITRCKGG
jgi:hypothetical protein